ncbi:MAG: hypothetical protein WBN49_08650, partial [Arenicellales bacterium]
DRIVPEGQKPGEPAELSLEDAERLREKRAKKSAAYDSGSGKNFGAQRGGRYSENRNSGRESLKSPKPSTKSGLDPWAKWRK